MKMQIFILLLLGMFCTSPMLSAKDHGPSKGIRNADAIVGMSLDVVETLARLVTPAPVVTYPAPVVVQPAPTTVTLPSPVYVQPSATTIVTSSPVYAQPPVYVQPAPVIVQPSPVYVRPAPRIKIRPVYRNPGPPNPHGSGPRH